MSAETPVQSAGTFTRLRLRFRDWRGTRPFGAGLFTLLGGIPIAYFPYATLKLGEEPAVRRRAVAQARVQVGRSMRFVGQQAVQLHGGIGMTEEYAGSHYFRKLTTLEMQYGDTMHALGEVSARMQDTAGVFA